MITVFFYPGTLSRLYFPRSKEVHLDYSTYAANLIISCSRALPFATIFSQYYSEKKFLFRISLGSSSACAFFVSRRVAHQKRICDDLISKRPAQEACIMHGTDADPIQQPQKAIAEPSPGGKWFRFARDNPLG
jgi:hypothetical protein